MMALAAAATAVAAAVAAVAVAAGAAAAAVVVAATGARGGVLSAVRRCKEREGIRHSTKSLRHMHCGP
jgi:hypothetical protein